MARESSTLSTLMFPGFGGDEQVALAQRSRQFDGGFGNILCERHLDDFVRPDGGFAIVAASLQERVLREQHLEIHAEQTQRGFLQGAVLDHELAAIAQREIELRRGAVLIRLGVFRGLVERGDLVGLVDHRLEPVTPQSGRQRGQRCARRWPSRRAGFS